jgi:hypothetical protein
MCTGEFILKMGAEDRVVRMQREKSQATAVQLALAHAPNLDTQTL